MVFPTLCIGALVIYLCFHLTKRIRRNSKLPPGPRGLPIFGNLLSLMKEPAQTMSKWSEIYGPVFTVYFGRKPVITVCDYEEMNEILMKKESTGRPTNGIFSQLSNGYGIILSTGEIWSVSRKMLYQYFRDSGENKMEEAIAEELKNVINKLKQVANEKSSINLFHLMSQSTSNVISWLCYGKLFQYEDPVFMKNIERISYNFRLLYITQSLAAFKPFISPLLYFLERIILDNGIKLRETIKSIIHEHNEVFNDEKGKDVPTDFMYNFLSIAKKEEMELGRNKIFTKKQLLEMTVDVFFAGTETVSSSIRWFIWFMLKNPQVKDRLQAEMDQVIGRSRLPSLLDKDSLPYTVACLQETERLASVAHLAVTHTCLEDIEYKDYILPKGVDVMYNVWGVHHDPKLWSNPEKFDPGRFIDSNGEVFRPKYLIPFGKGRRLCPGENFAKIEMFMYITTLFHAFDFHEVLEDSEMATNQRSGLTRQPEYYKVSVTCRDLS